MLKPQDVVVAIKLFLVGKQETSYARLAAELELSASEVHAAVKRGTAARLLVPSSNAGIPRPARLALQEFLVSGLKYVWLPNLGSLTRGVPTGVSHPETQSTLQLVEPETPIVWPHPEGTVRGLAVTPLYGKVVTACLRDSALYGWLALIDVIRLRNGREAALAIDAINQKLA